uniref:Uncharacterized protein n=1 Tax=Romanomermis culicivorax TaxID=13658 RepID=A0A915K9E9_ROMCU
MQQIHNLQSKISDDKSLPDSSPLNPGGVEEVSYYLQQIQMLEAGKALVTSQMLELEKSLSDTERTLEGTRRENSLLLEKSAQISKRNADLSAKIDEESAVKRALNDNIRVLQEKIVDLTSELNSRPSEDDVAVLRKALIDAQTLMNEITCEKESEIDKLRIKLISFDEKFANARKSIEELQRELDKRPKPEDLQKMRNNLAEAQEYKVDIIKLREDFEGKKIENINLKKDLEDMEQKSTEQKAAMATLTADISRLQSMLLDAEESSSKLKKQKEE